MTLPKTILWEVYGGVRKSFEIILGAYPRFGITLGKKDFNYY